MASAVTTPDGAGLTSPPERLSLLERLKKGDEVAFLVTFASALTIILITVLLVQQLWVQSAQSPPAVRVSLPQHQYVGSRPGGTSGPCHSSTAQS